MNCNSIIDVTKRPDGIGIFLGVWDTLNVTSQQFDISAWQAAYGVGQVAVIVQRNGDPLPYQAANVTLDNGVVTWTFDEMDTAIVGDGSAALVYIVGGEHKARTTPYHTYTAPTLGQSPPPIDPWENWYERVLEAAMDAQQSAQEAQNSATEAGGYADAAQQAAQTAAEDAVSDAEALLNEYVSAARISANAASGYADAAETAQVAAQSAGQRAASSASNAAVSATEARRAATDAAESAADAQRALEGMIYVTFTVDADGHVLIQNGDLLGTTSFELVPVGDNNEGHLEVTY